MIRKNSNDNNSVNIEKLLIDCQQTGIIRYPTISQALTFLVENPNDVQLKEIIHESLAEFRATQIIDPDPFTTTSPIFSENLTGSIGLGFIPPENIVWRISPEMLTSHMLIIGRTGGGKTNLILLILLQLLEMRKNAENI